MLARKIFYSEYFICIAEYVYLGIILSALSFSDVQFCGRDDLMKFTRHFENHIGEG